jgi:hypothetical protein
MQLGYGCGLWRGLFLQRGHPLSLPPAIGRLEAVPGVSASA